MDQSRAGEKGGQALYSIGEFAKMVGLPISALRFYDEHGLLTPEIRDQYSNYRYYSETQAMEALFIMAMKRLDLPLLEIKKLMKEKRLSQVQSNLEMHVASLRREIDRLQFQCDYATQLYNQIAAGLSLSGEPGEEQREDAPQQSGFSMSYIPPCHAVSAMARGRFDGSEYFVKYHVKLEDICEERRLHIAGPLTAHFFHPMDTRFQAEEYDAEWLLPVENREGESLGLKYYEGYWGVAGVYVGRHSEIRDFYREILDWIREKGYEIAGPPREEYVVNCVHVSDGRKWITRLTFPIRADSLPGIKKK